MSVNPETWAQVVVALKWRPSNTICSEISSNQARRDFMQLWAWLKLAKRRKQAFFVWLVWINLHFIGILYLFSQKSCFFPYVCLHGQFYANETAENFEWLDNCLDIYIYIYLRARTYFRKHFCFLTRELPAREMPIRILIPVTVYMLTGVHSHVTLRALQEIGYCTVIYVPHRLRTNFVLLTLEN